MEPGIRQIVRHNAQDWLVASEEAKHCGQTIDKAERTEKDLCRLPS
jgi:hypothetical protein